MASTRLSAEGGAVRVSRGFLAASAAVSVTRARALPCAERRPTRTRPWSDTRSGAVTGESQPPVDPDHKAPTREQGKDAPQFRHRKGARDKKETALCLGAPADSDLAEPSQSEPSQTGPSPAEPSRAGPGRAEPSRAEPSIA